MNVYDFDKTIYNGDCSIDFYLYCLSRCFAIVSCLPSQLCGIVMKLLGKCDTKTMKEKFFCFLPKMPDAENVIKSFWSIHRKKIKRFYLAQRQESDVIISASPEFLLTPICRELGIPSPIATEMDINTGKILGRNCKGEEKVRRFCEHYPNGVVEKFYSDSVSDAPMAEIAQEAFLVCGDRINPWPRKDESQHDKK